MLKKLTNIEFRKILLYILIGSLIIDNINGICIQEKIFEVSIGQIYRIIAYIFLLVYLLKFYKRKIVKYSLLLLFFAILPICYNENISNIIKEYMYIAKLLYPILLIMVMYKGYKVNEFDVSDIYKIIDIYMLLAPLTLVIPKIFSVGYYSYSFDSGYKGFYVANNEINIVLLVTFIYSIKRLYSSINKKNVIIAILNLIALFLIGSKTSIIVIIFTVLIFSVLIVTKKYEGKKRIILFTFIICTIILLAILASTYLKKIIERFIFFYNMLVVDGNNNFVTFLLSGRDTRIWPAVQKNILQNKNGLFNFLFGVGRNNQFVESDLSTIIEMDFLDTLLWYGSIVAISILTIYTTILCIGLKSKNKNINIVIYLLIYVFALIAGHVWYSPLASTLFALISTIILIENNKEVSRK